MSAQMRSAASEGHASKPLRPYLVTFASWWVLAMFVTSVRVPVKPWRFVVELFWWQALLLEKIFGVQSPLFARGIWLAAYAAIAVACCWTIERMGRSPAHVWRRAWICAGAAQLCLLVVAMATSAE